MTVETRWASLLVTDYLSHDVGGAAPIWFASSAGRPRRW
jgi:hypothetical protein